MWVAGSHQSLSQEAQRETRVPAIPTNSRSCCWVRGCSLRTVLGRSERKTKVGRDRGEWWQAGRRAESSMQGWRAESSMQARRGEHLRDDWILRTLPLRIRDPICGFIAGRVWEKSGDEGVSP